VHPFGSPKQLDTGGPATDLKLSLSLPSDVAAVLRRSCLDCHSNQTVWPWYSYIAPASWLVERDVSEGRDHVNLSFWREYTWEERRKLLADFASVVKNGEMPLPQYTWIHPGAKLSAADIDVLFRWARTERRKMSAAAARTEPSAGKGE
jgi:hypothetical protein